ncbi:lysophospholipid acyltransferase family protein [Laceyella putida]|uniref:Lysophospholipid acyltransferase family protein n=1 Tax=Laceyella putida TaxID=110101 RepID=A0ABW2RNA0_9BACL
MYEWIAKITTDEKRLSQLQRWVSVIPRTVCYPFFCLLGDTVYALAKKERTRVLRNMRQLLPDQSDQMLSRYGREYFRSVIIALYEILIDSSNLHKSLDWRFKVEGEEVLQQVLEQGRGAILFTPHLGNFFYYYWYLSMKYPCLTVVTAQSEEIRPFYLLFQRLGCDGLDYDETPPLLMMKKLTSHLKDNGVVFLLGDFYRPQFPESVFFGKKTRTPGGAAVLSLEQQIPVVPFMGYRDRQFRHRLIFGEPIHLYEKFDRKQRMEAINSLNVEMEKMVKDAPGQWFYWFNADERWEKEETSSEAC